MNDCSYIWVFYCVYFVCLALLTACSALTVSNREANTPTAANSTEFLDDWDQQNSLRPSNAESLQADILMFNKCVEKSKVLITEADRTFARFWVAHMNMIVENELYIKWPWKCACNNNNCSQPTETKYYKNNCCAESVSHFRRVRSTQLSISSHLEFSISYAIEKTQPLHCSESEFDSIYIKSFEHRREYCTHICNVEMNIFIGTDSIKFRLYRFRWKCMTPFIEHIDIFLSAVHHLFPVLWCASFSSIVEWTTGKHSKLLICRWYVLRVHKSTIDGR